MPMQLDALVMFRVQRWGSRHAKSSASAARTGSGITAMWP
jgi:hypothetical protein